MDFPQYRKRFDNKSYYKVINEESMQEVQRIGKKIFYHELKADKYFEKILISDIISAPNDVYQVISEEEWNEVFEMLDVRC